MPTRPPKRPEKGAPIPHDWFGDFYDYVRSLECRGDLATTVVSRDRTGTVIRAPFATTDRVGGTQDASDTRLAVITADNANGTYDADEVKLDTAQGDNFAVPSLGPLTFDSGNNGNLYELNGRAGVPVGTHVVVHRLQDSNTNSVYWYFDATSDQYGFDGLATTSGGDGTVGAWVELTSSSSPYSWKQKDPDATTDTTGVTGSNNLYEVNGRDGIPAGSIVWAWFDGTSYRCEYHGADAGTPLTLQADNSATAETDDWDRSNQGTARGVIAQWLTRGFFNSTTYELLFFSRSNTKDANGHDTLIDAESEQIGLVLDSSAVSTNTYPYKNCDTDAVVARFTLDDLPDDEYCWVYNASSGEMEKCYRDTVSAGAATSPVPCVLYQATTPTGCGDLDLTVFEDDFNGTNGDSLNDCRWSRISSDGTAEIQSNELRISIAENTTGSSDGEEKWENAYVFGGDFDIEVTIDSTGLDQTTANGEFLRADLQLVGAGSLFRALTIGAWPPDSGFLPSQFGYDFQQDGSPSSNNGATLSAGTHLFRFVRVGTALTGYINGNSFSFNSTSGDVQARIRVIGTGSSNPAISADFENFTINSAD